MGGRTEEEQEWGNLADISSAIADGRVSTPQYLMREASLRSSLLNSIQDQARRRSRVSRTESVDSAEELDTFDENPFSEGEEEDALEGEAFQPNVDIREELFTQYPDPYPHSVSFQRVIITDSEDEVPKDTRKACESLLRFSFFSQPFFHV